MKKRSCQDINVESSKQVRKIMIKTKTMKILKHGYRHPGANQNNKNGIGSLVYKYWTRNKTKLYQLKTKSMRGCSSFSLEWR